MDFRTLIFVAETDTVGHIKEPGSGNGGGELARLCDSKRFVPPRAIWPTELNAPREDLCEQCRLLALRGELLTVPAELDEVCEHRKTRVRRASGAEPCRLVRKCLCGANARCPRGCGRSTRSDPECGCPRIIKNYYCPYCGSGRCVRDWLHSYIAHDVRMLCLTCRLGFPNTLLGRWLSMKFSGTSAMKYRDGKPMVGKFKLEHPRNQKILKRVLGVIGG